LAATAGDWPSRLAQGLVLDLLPLAAAAVLFGLSLRDSKLNEPFFVHGAYYALFGLSLAYVGVRLHGLGDVAQSRDWLKEHLPGLVAAAVITTIVVLAVPAGFRVLADETNLIGVSKNLFFHRTADFVVTGKWYFENYWSLDRATARRPILFQFLVSLVHVVRGYDANNGFYLNALVFACFVFSSYRLAKSLGGQTLGLVAAVLVAAAPNVLVVTRSAGFDLLATYLLLLVVSSFLDYLRAPTPRRLALVVLHLCLLTHVRYEGVGLLIVAIVVLAALRVLKPANLRGYGWLYSWLPLCLLPRYWQAIAKADDAEQPLSASLFGTSYFAQNVGELLQPLKKPFEANGPHASLVILLAGSGCALLLVRLFQRARARTLTRTGVYFSLFVLALVSAEAAVCFLYNWGHPQHPASARLFVWFDALTAFCAAYCLFWIGRLLTTTASGVRRLSSALVPMFLSAMLFAMHVPAASEGRYINALVLTRSAAESWRFFESLGDKRILVLSDRPGLFTVMDYGASHITNADRGPLLELSRHLYQDIYLVQEVDLATHEPKPKFDPWPDVAKETVMEFQCSATDSIRIAKVKH